MVERGQWCPISPRKESNRPTHTQAEKCFYLFLATSGNFQLIATDQGLLPPITKPEAELSPQDLKEMTLAQEQASLAVDLLHRRETLWYQPRHIEVAPKGSLQQEPNNPKMIINQN